MHARTNPRARDVAPSTRLLSVFRDSTHDMGGTRDKPTPLGGRGWFSHTYGSKNHHRVPGGGAAGCCCGHADDGIRENEHGLRLSTSEQKDNISQTSTSTGKLSQGLVSEKGCPITVCAVKWRYSFRSEGCPFAMTTEDDPKWRIFCVARIKPVGEGEAAAVVQELSLIHI